MTKIFYVTSLIADIPATPRFDSEPTCGRNVSTTYGDSQCMLHCHQDISRQAVAKIPRRLLQPSRVESPGSWRVYLVVNRHPVPWPRNCCVRESHVVFNNWHGRTETSMWSCLAWWARPSDQKHLLGAHIRCSYFTKSMKIKRRRVSFSVQGSQLLKLLFLWVERKVV